MEENDVRERFVEVLRLEFVLHRKATFGDPNFEPTAQDEQNERELWAYLWDKDQALLEGLRGMVAETFGYDFEVKRVFYSRGSITAGVVIGSLFSVIAGYGGVRQTFDYLRDDIPKAQKAMKTVFRNVLVGNTSFLHVDDARIIQAPEVLDSDSEPQEPTPTTANNGALERSTINSTSRPPVPFSTSGPLLWYLLITNGALILFLAAMLVWAFAASQW